MSIDIASIDMVSEVNMVSNLPHRCDAVRETDCIGRLFCLFSTVSNKQMERLEIRLSPVGLFTCCSAAADGKDSPSSPPPPFSAQ